MTCATAPGGASGRGRGRRDGRARAALRRAQPAAGARRRVRGWAIPTATDIAFALAVLAVIGTHLPVGAADLPAHPGRGRRPAGDHHHRDLLHHGRCSSLRCCWRCCRSALFAVLVQRRVRSWWLLLPLAVATWALVHASGVHATVAGVLLGSPSRCRAARRRARPPGLAEHFEHRLPADLRRLRRAGVRVLRRGRHRRRPGGLGATLTDPVALGIIVGLVVGKRIGVLGGHLAGAAVHPARWTKTCAGATSSGWPCWPGSGSPCPC